MRLRAIAATASLDRVRLKAPGTVEILPPSSGRIPARTAALFAVKQHARGRANQQIDVLLHADAVKRPERKGVNGENISAEHRQLIAERS